VTVTNQSAAVLTGWTVSFQLPLGGVMTSVPGFGFGQLGTSITVWSPSGLTLPANGQVSFTFNATGLVPASGSSFSLNGIACQG
jgi:Cellulose binding domain